MIFAAKIINLVEVRTITSTLQEFGAKLSMALRGNNNNNNIQRNPVSSFHRVVYVKMFRTETKGS